MPITVPTRMLDIRPGEARAVGWSFVYFFSLLGSYYILRPIRDEMGVVAGVDQLQWLFTGTLIAMLAIVPLFGWLTSRYPRRRFLPAAYLFFIANILVFHGLFVTWPGSRQVAIAFFIWLSVFNLFVVSVFWSFMTDLYRDDQAKRLFGIIAAGGTVGAIAGPAVTAILVREIGTGQLLLISTALLVLALICISRLLAWRRDRTGSDAHERDEDQAMGGGLFDGIRLMLRSPYLLGIAGLILLYTTLSTFLYFQQAQIVKDAFADSATRVAVFAGIDFAVNTLTLIGQTLLTSRLVKWFGLGMTLALIPLFLGAGFAALALFPVLPVLIVVQVVRRAGNYAVMRPAREMLYVVLTREEKYKAKNVIDTVVYRGGDAVSAWVYTGMKALGMNIAAIAWVGVPLSLLWAWVAFRLGGRQETLAAHQTQQPED